MNSEYASTAHLIDEEYISDSDDLSIAEQHQLLDLQRAILESIARGADHMEVINDICRLEERLLPNSAASVMLLDNTGNSLNVYAAPSMPPEGIALLNGLRPGPGTGACGNAIYQKKPQFISNSRTDERWCDLRELAEKIDICACWSVPIYSGNQQIIGTFAISSFEQRMPATFHRMMLDIGSSIIGIVLEKNKSEETLRQLGKVFEGSEEGIMITDAYKRIMSVNPAFTKVLGYTIDDLRGQTPKALSSGQHPKEFYLNMWESIRHFGHWRGEIWNRRKNGEVYPEWLSISEVKNASGEVTHYVGTFSDISSIKSAEKEIEYLSSHDALTGLPNIAIFKDRLKTAISLAASSQKKVALLALDLDNFKFLNDSLGYEAGDQILRLFADRFKASLQQTDSICRHGGDEFIILLNHMPDDESISNNVDALLRLAATPIHYADRAITISCSIGVAVTPTDGDRFETLFDRAGKAVALAKAEGRNTARFFTEQLQTDSIHYLNIAHGLRDALLQQQFELHYQPQICLKSQRVIGAEALVRWRHPQLGLQAPAQFISIAEQTGLIVEMGAWIIHEACRQAVIWQQAGLPRLMMGVNVSAVQFRRGNLQQIITHALETSGLHPSLLELELTESIFLENVDHMLAQLKALKQLGVKLALDDFGTGYSSFAYLKKFNIDRLKIDQSFVRDINSDPNDAAIVRAIAQMAHTLHLRVIAEGVEDAAMLKHLRECQCDEAQGYLFSKPLPASEFAAYLQQQRHHYRF